MMPRTVAAIFSSRAEAETARARLSAQLSAADVQIVGRHDAAVIDHLGFAREDRDHYRDAVANGDFLLCAHVASGEDPDRIVQSLTEAISAPPPATGEVPSIESQTASGVSSRGTKTALFVNEARVMRGGASVVLPKPEVERPIYERWSFAPEGTIRMDRSAILSAGLFRDRTIEASEMSEVSVVERHAVVREEVVLRKSVTERTETITDTVRRTAIDVTELGSEKPGSQPHRQR